MRTGIVIVSLVAGAGALQGTLQPPTPGPERVVEIGRLQAHFDSIDSELKTRNVALLSARQKSRRAEMVSWLRDYRNSAEFPLNDRFAEPTPFFRDSKGALCAMAYLIQRSGRSDIVDKVQSTRNNAYIAELVDDPALVAWLDSSGLSAAEAARIQPAYGGVPLPDHPPRREVDRDFALAAVGLGSVSLASTAINVVQPSVVSGLLGIFAGAVSVGIAANNFDHNRATDRVATATLGLGAVSLGAGIYGLLEARRDNGDHDWERDRRRGRGRNRFSMTVLPDVVIQKADARLGMQVRGRF